MYESIYPKATVTSKSNEWAFDYMGGEKTLTGEKLSTKAADAEKSSPAFKRMR
ncbi:MAG: hypothetical protein O7D30_05085 [Rickettsia endosymbiont of Ixodes persulcatus]|nr:hypothetical protein [Rickettsia endosymbiont of Ixodes persulcatus]